MTYNVYLHLTEKPKVPFCRFYIALHSPPFLAKIHSLVLMKEVVATQFSCLFLINHSK